MKTQINKTVETRLKLNVKVIPNSAKNQVVGWFDGRLKLKVTAQAEKGKANKAVIKLLSKSLRLSPQNIYLVSGDTQSLKVFELSSLNQEQLHQRIDALLK